MRNRREFLKDFAGATAGVFFVGCGLRDAAAAALQSSGATRRREVWYVAPEAASAGKVSLECQIGCSGSSGHGKDSLGFRE